MQDLKRITATVCRRRIITDDDGNGDDDGIDDDEPADGGDAMMTTMSLMTTTTATMMILSTKGGPVYRTGPGPANQKPMKTIKAIGKPYKSCIQGRPGLPGPGRGQPARNQ